MYLSTYRAAIAAEIEKLVTCPANFVTLDAPDRAWVDRSPIFSKGLRMWHETNKAVFGKRWRECKQGLLTIFVVESQKRIWHIHMIQEKHPSLDFNTYSGAWLRIWEDEKKRRDWERRGIHRRDLNRPEWPRRCVDVRPYNPNYHPSYMTKQVTESHMPFDSLGMFTNRPRVDDEKLRLLSEDELEKVLTKEMTRLKARPRKVPAFAASVLREPPRGKGVG